MQTPINLCNVYNPEGSVTLNINMVVRPCFLLRDYITAMAKKLSVVAAFCAEVVRTSKPGFVVTVFVRTSCDHFLV
jgi:hypothetical protein